MSRRQGRSCLQNDDCSDINTEILRHGSGDGEDDQTRQLITDEIRRTIDNTEHRMNQCDRFLAAQGRIFCGLDFYVNALQGKELG